MSETIWKRIANQCMVFRSGHLAPSGGWLASLVIPICQTTGIYDFTILGALYTYLFIFFRSASCEAAIVIGLGFDVTIPCQYLNAGVHTKELAAYWPKLIMATVAEFGCYLLLDDPDLFNMIVFAKTSITLYLWMSTKKQWPLVFPPGKGPRSGSTAQPTAPRTTSKSGKGKGKNPLCTPEYLGTYLPNKLVKMRTNTNPEKKAEYDRLMQNMERPMEDPKYSAAIAKLQKMTVKTPEEYAEAYPNGVAGAGSKAAGRAVAPQNTAGQAAGASTGSGASGSGAGPTGPQPVGAGTGAGTGTGAAPSGVQPVAQPTAGQAQNGPPPPQFTSGDHLTADTDSPGNGWSSDPKSREKLSKEETTRIANALNVVVKSGQTTLNTAAYGEAMKAFAKPMGDRNFQITARKLNKFLPDLKVPEIEWKPPSEQEVQALIEDCKRRLERDTDEDREALLTQENLDDLKRAIAEGPYESPNWDWAHRFCKLGREADCPQWLDPLPMFVDGYHIPWETQLEVASQIMASQAPDDHKRGFVEALNMYYRDWDQYLANMKAIDVETGLKLQDAKIYEKSRYLPYYATHNDPDVGKILISAAHYKEAKWVARQNEMSAQFDKVAQTIGTNKQTDKSLCKEFNWGSWAARTEHYTDYHSGTRRLAPSYLQALRKRWTMDPNFKNMEISEVDLILYVIKNNLTPDPEGFVQRCDAARLSNKLDSETKQYDQYRYNVREERWAIRLCALLEDQWVGEGGISTKRTSMGEKYW